MLFWSISSAISPLVIPAALIGASSIGYLLGWLLGESPVRSQFTFGEGLKGNTASNGTVINNTSDARVSGAPTSTMASMEAGVL